MSRPSALEPFTLESIMSDQINVSKLAETKLTGWDDPDAGSKLRQLFLDVATENKDIPRRYLAESQRLVMEGSLAALQQLTHLAISAIGAGLLAEGVGDTVRVEVVNDANSISLRVFGLAKSGDREVLFGEFSQTHTMPSASEGITFAYRLHITPQGGRPLWDYGDIIEAQSETVGGGN